MPEDILTKLKDLPEEVQDYLLSDGLADANSQIIKKYNLHDKKDDFFDILNQLFLKEISIESLPALLFSKLQIKDDKIVKEFSENIVKKILSPVADYFGIQKTKKDDSLTDKAIKKFNFQFNDAARMKFSEIAETFLSNVRTKSQFKNTLIKSAADGGLAMDHQLADDVAEFLASYMRIGEIEKKKNDILSAVIPSEAQAEPRDLTLSKKQTGKISPRAPLGRNDKKVSIPRPVPPNVKIEISFEKEEKEAAKQKPKIEKIKIQAPKLLSVTEGVKNALAELNYTFPSSELQERLKSVLDARVRNVRTSVQTFEKLTQDIGSGGMGFTKAEADKVSLVLNKYLEEKNKDIYDGKLSEIKQAEDEEKRKNEERARLAEEAEKQKLDARFTKLTGKTPPPMPAAASEAGQSPPALTKKEIAAKKNNDELPASPSQGGRITNYELRKEKPVPVSSPPALPPRPVLEDIKFTPKLAGPLEEIGRLTLEDFRKLSHDPKEAILKIKDKLQLLRGESYKKYQAGIEAWQKSPLYGEYLKVMSQSLIAGAPLEDALKAGQTLTKEEFDGILNSRME